MGIKGLFSFMKRWDTVVPVIEAIKGKRVAIDLFWFLHRTKGNFPKLQASLQPFLDYAQHLHVVIDGTETTEQRRAELDERQEYRKEKQSVLDEIIHTLQQDEWGEDSRMILERYSNQLRSQIWTPSPDYIQQTVAWLIGFPHVTVIRTVGEADTMLYQLEQQVDLVVSNDSDLVMQGVNRLLRINTNMDGSARVFDKQMVIRHLAFTEQQWDDFLWLLKHMKSTDILLAFSLISVYRGRDRALMRWKEMHGVELTH
jgi:hypothetical protein